MNHALPPCALLFSKTRPFWAGKAARFSPQASSTANSAILGVSLLTCPPASLPCTTSASGRSSALARAAGVQPQEVVWDPFVGSGLELIERARKAKTGEPEADFADAAV